jgi:hypothetical protein
MIIYIRLQIPTELFFNSDADGGRNHFLGRKAAVDCCAVSEAVAFVELQRLMGIA